MRMVDLLASKKIKYTLNDLTMIICVRFHENNPWLLERLNNLGGYYDPAPKFLIVDFGSEPEWAQKVEGACKANDFDYHYIADEGIYSNGFARNIGFQQCTTDLIYFTDIDFLMPRDGAKKIIDLANILNIQQHKDTILTMPAIHVAEERTEEFHKIENNNDKSAFLERLAFYGMMTKVGTDFEFIAPYSNNFICHRDMFDRVGGYSNAFRGHGSEDFEFFLRYCLLMNTIPEPTSVSKDFYGPKKSSYYSEKSYAGFRRMLELLTLPSEMAGLKSFHLWHPTLNNTAWRKNNDWKRTTFNSVVNTYNNKKSGLLQVDSLPRTKTYLCIVKHEEHWRYFVPLRNAGIKTIPVSSDKPQDLWEFAQMIEKGEVDGVAVFNPYMKSHATVRTLF